MNNAVLLLGVTPGGDGKQSKKQQGQPLLSELPGLGSSRVVQNWECLRTDRGLTLSWCHADIRYLVLWCFLVCHDDWSISL